MNLVGCSSCKPLDLKVNMLTFITRSIFVIAYWEKCSFPGNPLSQDILNIYQEPDGTRKLLNYMLDNLAGITATETHMLEKPLSCWLKFTLFPPKLVHPEQLPQRPWITLKERDQMVPTGTSQHPFTDVWHSLTTAKLILSVFLKLCSQLCATTYCVTSMQQDSCTATVRPGRLTGNTGRKASWRRSQTVMRTSSACRLFSLMRLCRLISRSRHVKIESEAGVGKNLKDR